VTLSGFGLERINQEGLAGEQTWIHNRLTSCLHSQPEIQYSSL